MLASGRAVARGAPPEISPQVCGDLWSGSVVVPADFLGVHMHRFPKAREGAASNSPAPTYPFHTWRSHDYAPNFNGGVAWRGLHAGSADFASGTAAGCWADLDQAIDLHFAAGRNVAYCIWGTPAWAAASPSQPDPYGGLGGNSPPSSQASLSEFVTRLVQRYNTELIRNNGGQKKLRFLEIWNEPTYTVASNSFFIGTEADMAAMARTVKLAAKAVDPSIVLVSPSFTGNTSHITSFLNASDGAGGFGRDHVDAIAYHPYSTDLPGSSPLGKSVGTPMTVDANVRAAVVAGGLAGSTPLHNMEIGIASSSTDTLLSRAPVWKAQYVARISALYAALGWQKVVWYGHDNNLSGNPSISPEVGDALAWAAQLAGKTLTSVRLLSNGRIRVTHSGGVMVY